MSVYCFTILADSLSGLWEGQEEVTVENAVLATLWFIWRQRNARIFLSETASVVSPRFTLRSVGFFTRAAGGFRCCSNSVLQRNL